MGKQGKGDKKIRLVSDTGGSVSFCRKKEQKKMGEKYQRNSIRKFPRNVRNEFPQAL